MIHEYFYLSKKIMLLCETPLFIEVKQCFYISPITLARNFVRISLTT